MQQISHEPRPPSLGPAAQRLLRGSFAWPPPQEHSGGSWAPAGREKAAQAWGVAARGSKALPGSQEHEISSSEQAGAKNSFCHCKLAAFGQPRAEFCAWDAAGEAPPPWHWSQSLLGRPRSEQRAGVPARGAGGVLSVAPKAPCLGHQPQKTKGFVAGGLDEQGGAMPVPGLREVRETGAQIHRGVTG